MAVVAADMPVAVVVDMVPAVDMAVAPDYHTVVAAVAALLRQYTPTML